MGAAGSVAVYDAQRVRDEYSRLFPQCDIDEDWWYLTTITGALDGKAWIFDYGDDQGYHNGTADSFWFASPEAQTRVRDVLHRVKYESLVEVWT